MFAEDSTCTASLQGLKAQGFFRDLSDQTCCAALSAGSFKKMLVYHMLRSVTRAQFVDRLLEDLRPRLQKTGDEGLLPPFISYFNDKSFDAGTQFLMLWTGKSPSAHAKDWLVMWARCMQVQTCDCINPGLQATCWGYVSRRYHYLCILLLPCMSSAFRTKCLPCSRHPSL